MVVILKQIQDDTQVSPVILKQVQDDDIFWIGLHFQPAMLQFGQHIAREHIAFVDMRIA